MTDRAQILKESAVKRVSSYGSYPWAIVHVPTGQRVQGLPETIDHPDLGMTTISGPSLFQRKRDAQAALDRLRAVAPQRGANPTPIRRRKLNPRPPRTVEEAHAAGRRDGSQGLGPIFPPAGPLRDAYKQSYNDALVARVGVPERRRNARKRGKTATTTTRATVPRKRGKTVTTTTRATVIRRTNRRARARVVLYAQRPGKRRLKYLGRGKFGERGRPMLFKSVASADLAAWILRDSHPQALRGWMLKAV